MLLLLTACIDNALNAEKADPPGFDTGGQESAPPVDTSETGPDSGGTDTGVFTQPCEVRSFAGHALTEAEDCGGGVASTPAWDVELHWSDASLGWMISSPVIVNLTDDNGNGRIDDNDTPDLIAAPYSGGIYAIDGADGSRIWSVSTSGIEQSTPAVGDVDGDGFPEVFVQGLYGSYMLSGIDGATLWTGPAADQIKTYCGAPGMADLDGDGAIEVYFGRMIMDAATGSVLARGTGGQGTSIPGEGPISVAADIDLDGILEIVAGNTVYEPDGSTLWYNSGERDGFPAVANFDGDPEAEILVGQQGQVSLYDTDGTLLWTYMLPGAGSYSGPPAVADVDGDGIPEAIVPYVSGVVVLDADGNLVWDYSHAQGTLYDGVSAYDFDADGDWEVVLNCDDGILLFDGASGTLIDSYDHGGIYACGQEPTMADVDNDGHAEIAFTFGVSSGASGGVGVLGDTSGFAAALSTWNQHAYSITNIENDGEVPVSRDENWQDINNFRAGPPISYVYTDKNLVGDIYDICARCGVGEVTVWWALGNNGSEVVEDDVTVEFWAATGTGDVLIGTEIWTEDLPARWLADSVETTLPVVAPVYDIWISIDGGTDPDRSEIAECDETDNEYVWGALVCT
jgi:hypothetical protein